MKNVLRQLFQADLSWGNISSSSILVFAPKLLVFCRISPRIIWPHRKKAARRKPSIKQFCDSFKNLQSFFKVSPYSSEIPARLSVYNLLNKQQLTHFLASESTRSQQSTYNVVHFCFCVMTSYVEQCQNTGLWTLVLSYSQAYP